MRLRVELVTQSNQTDKKFRTECEQECIKILDFMEHRYSKTYLVDIDLHKSRLFLPCRAIVEFPPRAPRWMLLEKSG